MGVAGFSGGGVHVHVCVCVCACMCVHVCVCVCVCVSRCSHYNSCTYCGSLHFGFCDPQSYIALYPGGTTSVYRHNGCHNNAIVVVM